MQYDKQMIKHENNVNVKPMDAIILINDNYINYNLKQGYIGVVVDNLIQINNYVLADFFNPLTGKDIAVQIEIAKDDFRILSNSIKDQLAVKVFKDICKNKV